MNYHGSYLLETIEWLGAKVIFPSICVYIPSWKERIPCSFALLKMMFVCNGGICVYLDNQIYFNTHKHVYGYYYVYICIGVCIHIYIYLCIFSLAHGVTTTSESPTSPKMEELRDVLRLTQRLALPLLIERVVFGINKKTWFLGGISWDSCQMLHLYL